MQNDPDRLYLVKKISRAFRHDEDAVMQRLEEIYASGGPSKLKFKEISKSPKNEVSDVEINDNINDSDNVTTDEIGKSNEKKKGGLKKIIILVIAIAALGGGGYFGYNMFMSEAPSDDTHSEEGIHVEASHDNHSESSHDQVVNDSIINDVESKINQAEAEKDSTIEDIKDAAEALHVIGL
jgi:uncharacterized protein HemX